MLKWKRIGVSMVAFLGLSACGEQAATGDFSTSLEQGLKSLVEQEPLVPGVLLAVRYGDKTYEGVVGNRSFEGEPLEAGDLFRIASVTKTFTSAAVFVAVEQGYFELETTLDLLLDAESVSLLEAGGYAPSEITVYQLLTHTAGIFDYTEAESFYTILEDDPTHRWTREEQLTLAMEEGAPLNAPGEAYHYGDTHYILLGALLERSFDTSLAEAFRLALQYDQWSQGDTFLESLEDPADAGVLDRLTHPYIGETDTRDWDPSWDLYGGGGLVSSAEDLVHFGDALFGLNGQLFASQETLETFLEMPEVGLEEFSGMDGGAGINRFYYGDLTCYAGLGFFTTWLVHCPELDLTFAATENQSEPDAADRIVELVIEAALSL